MKGIFDQTEIKGMALRNRFFRSATWEGMCGEDGRPTDKLIEYYRSLAAGGVGLIITGYTFVRPDGKQLPGKMGLHTDDFIDDMKKMTDAVHQEGGRICIQLVHCGGQTTPEVIGRTPIAPSAVESSQYLDVKPVEMTREDICDVITAFGDAARRAKESGFDAIQLHAAHGYLINQFLSPLTNRRNDEYGGSIKGRAKFLLDVYKSVNKAVGENFPVFAKLNGADNLDGALTIKDAVVAAKLLDNAGIDLIEVSGGTPASGAESPVRDKISKQEDEAYNLNLAEDIKTAVSCFVGSVGGYRSLEVIQKALEAGMDYISLARPLIREPDLPRRWESGDTGKAKCISCNKCFTPGLKEGGIYCVIEKELANKG